MFCHIGWYIEEQNNVERVYYASDFNGMSIDRSISIKMMKSMGFPDAQSQFNSDGVYHAPLKLDMNETRLSVQLNWIILRTAARNHRGNNEKITEIDRSPPPIRCRNHAMRCDDHHRHSTPIIISTSCRFHLGTFQNGSLTLAHKIFVCIVFVVDALPVWAFFFWIHSNPPAIYWIIAKEKYQISF